jgi:hypothetical protein
MSRGKRSTGKAIATRLLAEDSKRFTEYMEEKKVRQAEALRVLLKLGLDVALQKQAGDKDER